MKPIVVRVHKPAALPHAIIPTIPVVAMQIYMMIAVSKLARISL
jgi:hypothetical protein